MIDSLPGRRCASIRCFQHVLAGEPSTVGPIEFLWADGTWLTLDTNTDWTLDLSTQPWRDPYGAATGGEREVLAQEVGLWRQASTPGALSRLIGQVVTSAMPELNGVGELAGLRVVFETQVVAARVLGGNLVVEVAAPPA